MEDFERLDADAPLFRHEAVAGVRMRMRMGTPVASVGVASWLLTGFLAVVFVCVGIFVATAQYARRETVQGVLQPTTGALSGMTRLLTAIWAGNLSKRLASVAVAGLLFAGPAAAAIGDPPPTARGQPPPATDGGRVTVTIPMGGEPRSAHDPRTVLKGTCGHAEVELAFGDLGPSDPDGIRVVFDGRQVDAHDLRGLAKDITRPDLAYNFLLACSGTSIHLQIFAVSLGAPDGPKFYEGHASIDNAGKLVRYHGLERVKYSTVRNVFGVR